MGCDWDADDHERDGGMKAYGDLTEPIRVEELRPEQSPFWQDMYIGGRLGWNEVCARTVYEAGLRRIERVVARQAAGHHSVFYFDVTIQLDEARKLLDRTREEMRGGRRVSSRLRRWVERIEKNVRKLSGEAP